MFHLGTNALQVSMELGGIGRPLLFPYGPQIQKRDWESAARGLRFSFSCQISVPENSNFS